MPVDSASLFAAVIQEHLELKRRNAALEHEMPLEKYMPRRPVREPPALQDRGAGAGRGHARRRPVDRGRADLARLAGRVRGHVPRGAGRARPEERRRGRPPTRPLVALARLRLGRLTATPESVAGYPCLDARAEDVRPLRADRRPAARDRGARRRASLAGERYQTLLGATGTGKTATMAWIIEKVAAPGARDRAQQDARGAALQRVPRVLPRTTRSSTSSRTTTTTSPRRTSRRPTSTSRRTARGTTTSTGSGTRRPRTCSRGATSSSSPRSRASTASARRRSTSSGSSSSPSARSRTATSCCASCRHPVRPQRHAARPRPLPGQGRRARDPAGVLARPRTASRSSATRSRRSRTSTRSPARCCRGSTRSRSSRRRST